ncbi:MAG TPA: glycosyltransferase [Baekduia sp.]
MLLSVCIPTHDGRRVELVEALEAIVAQLGPEHAGRVEVCITDNASTDGTAGAMEALAREHPVVYRRHDRDIGPGANVLAAAALATGDWVWLHSSDDVLVPGAIAAVLRRLEDASDLAGLSVGRARLDRDMRHALPPEPAAVLPEDPARPHVYADAREALAQTGIMQSYLTSTIVRRSVWQAVLARDPGAPLRSTPYFPHTYIIGRALLDGAGAWGWEPRKLVLTRTGNEVFEALGGDAVGAAVFMARELTRTWRALLDPRDPALRALRARMQALWASPGWIEYVKLGPLAGTGSDVRLLGLVPPLWRLPRFWTESAPRLAVPRGLAQGARSARLRVLRMRRLPKTLGVARVTAELPPSAEAGASIRLRCTVEAFGTPRLRTAYPHPVYLAVDWGGPTQGRPASQRLALPATARPGRPTVMDVGTSAPWTPGDHSLTIGLWQDGVGRLDAVDPASAAVRTVRVVAQPGDDGSPGGAADAGRARRAALRAEVESIPHWWHSIDLGGIVTPGVKTPEILAAELAGLSMPDLRGLTVLDVGAWDGYYAFAAERAGAARVVALDHLVWSAELLRFTRLWSAVLEDLPPGRVPPDAVDVLQASELWDPVGLPGRAGFDLARRTLGSAVEPVVGDIAHDDLAELGRFDVVLFLGVLYHLRNPLDALRRLHARCGDLAIIETEAIAIGGHPDAAAAQFMGTRKRQHDPTNWWAPTVAGLERWCLEAGFSRVERVGVKPPAPRAGTTTPCRVTVHAWR